MRVRTCVGIATALLILGVGSATAQEQQAALEGVVRDSTGGVIPGVAVVTRNQAGFSAEAVTDAVGGYRFPSLPPGTYELRTSLTGFIPAVVTGIDLRLGRELTIDLILRPAGPGETVLVSIESPLIAVTQSARTTSVRDAEIEKMPKGRDFTSLATQAAGANNEQKLGGLSVDGSSGSENRFLIDGMESTDLLSGQSGQGLATDFVEELQVKSSGYSAEHGGSTGAVLNVVTRSGGSVWHGDALVYWSGDALDAKPRPTLQLNPIDPSQAEYIRYPEDAYLRIEPGGTLGGPLIRNRLWMFAGLVPSFQTLQRTVTFRADGSVRSFAQDTDVWNGAANAMTTLGSRGRVRAAFSNAGRQQRRYLPALDGTSNPNATYGIDDIRPRHSTALSADYAPSGKVLLGVRAGYFSNNQYNRGIYQGDRYIYQTSSLGLAGVPLEFQGPRLYSNLSTTATGAPANAGLDHAREKRIGLAVSGTTFFSARGQHELKAGLQFDRISYSELSGATGNIINFFWGLSLGGQRGAFGYYSLVSNGVFPNLGRIVQGKARVDNIGVFLQDSWRATPRLTLNLGVRTENERVPSFSSDPRIPKTAIHFGFRDKLAPRLGFALDVSGDGRTKAYGSWGLFYDIMKLALPLTYFGAFKGLTDYYTLETADISTIVDNLACPPQCPGRHILGPIDTAPSLNDPDNNMIDPDLRQMRLQEAVAGVERELRPTLSVGTRYIHKHLDRALDDIGAVTADGNDTFLIGNPGLGRAATFSPLGSSTLIAFPKARRDYNAVEATVDRRLSQNWSARVSYTWSRLSGNYSGLTESDLDGRSSPNLGFNFDSPMMSFDEKGTPVYGVLATDRTHQIKANVLVDLPFRTSFGVLAFAASGLPRTRVAQFSPGNDFQVMYRGRNSDGRLPSFRQIDLYVQHQLRLDARWRVTLSANVSNVLNASTATNYYAKELFQGQAIVVDDTQFYRGIDTQQLIAEQALVRDARFMMDSGYQAPRALRLGVRIGF